MYILSFSHDPNVIYHHDVNILSSFLIEYFVFSMRSLHEIYRAKNDFLSAFNYECTISSYYKLASIYTIREVVNMIVIWSNMLIIQSVTSFLFICCLIFYMRIKYSSRPHFFDNCYDTWFNPRCQKFSSSDIKLKR